MKIVYSESLQQVCAFLGTPISSKATVNKQPSQYIRASDRYAITGKYRDVKKAIETAKRGKPLIDYCLKGTECLSVLMKDSGI